MKIKKIIGGLLLSIIFSATIGFFLVPNSANAADKPFQPINPIDSIKIKIPGLDKLNQENQPVCVQGQSTVCSLPFIAIYIKAIYNYALGVGGVLAAIAIMIGGLTWLISAGNASRISEAKSWITGGLTGLLILMTSYILFGEINPSLLKLKPLDVKIVEEIMIDTTEPIDASSVPPINTNDWIPIPSDSNIINYAGGKKSSRASVEGLMKANECMKAAGFSVQVSDASRSVEEQANIYNQRYQTPNACNGDLKSEFAGAPVCCPFRTNAICPHTSGAALDVWGIEDSKRSRAAQYKLQECMASAGFCLLNAECWHFELPKLSGGCVSGTNNLNGKYCEGLK